MSTHIVLVGDDYYPTGWDDFLGAYDSLSDARIAAHARVIDETLKWYEIVDTATWQLVERGRSNAGGRP